MSPETQHTIETATALALATTGPHGVNVVPISVVSVTEDEIILYDFFMNKTVENIAADEAVALTGWKGFVGVQVKATAVYETSGAAFTAATLEMKEQFPDRTLNGVIRLTPTSVYDVSPGSGGKNITE